MITSRSSLSDQSAARAERRTNCPVAGRCSCRYSPATISQAARTGREFKSREWSARSSSSANRCGSARSRRTAPRPSHSRSARCSSSASQCGQPTFSAAGTPASVATRSTTAFWPVRIGPVVVSAQSVSTESISFGSPASQRTTPSSWTARAMKSPGTSTCIGGTL